MKERKIRAKTAEEKSRRRYSARREQRTAAAAAAGFLLAGVLTVLLLGNLPSAAALGVLAGTLTMAVTLILCRLTENGKDNCT